MSVPDFQSLFKPLLEFASDGHEHSLKEARERLAKDFELSEDDLNELLPSGTQKKFDNRVAWAKSYFTQAGVLISTRRGYFKISDRGTDLLKQGHERIDVKVLNQYQEFVEFHQNKPGQKEEVDTSKSETPEEILQQAYQNIRNDLAAELLRRVKNNNPEFLKNWLSTFWLQWGTEVQD